MKARDLLRAVEQYALAKHSITEQMLQDLTDDQVRMAVRVVAEMFRTLKKEAIRRNIWNDLITKKT